MSGTASYLTRFSVEAGASPTFSGSSLRWDANTLDPGFSQEIMERQGLRGTRLAHIVDTRLGNYTVRPTFSLNPSSKFLGQWLVFAMGGGSETAPAFADTLPEFGLLIDHSLDVYKILGCKVDTLSLRFSAGQLVECNVACVGKVITDDEAFAGAALGTTLAYEPYVGGDVTFTYDSGSDTPVLLDGELTINNGLSARMALGSLSANEVFPAIRRQTRFTGRAAFEAESLAMRDDHAGAGVSSGAVASLSLVNATCSTVFSFANMQLVPKYTVVEGSEIIVPIQAEVRATGAGTAEMTVTNDVTP